MWRLNDDGEAEVLLVHRPHHGDWTLPKGKVEAGEADEACALREVREETGLSCQLGTHLLDVEYDDAEGRPKVARYWEMRPLDGQFTPHGEVDRVRWLPAGRAVEAVSYPGDAQVLEVLSRLLG